MATVQSVDIPELSMSLAKYEVTQGIRNDEIIWYTMIGLTKRHYNLCEYRKPEAPSITAVSLTDIDIVSMKPLITR